MSEVSEAWGAHTAHADVETAQARVHVQCAKPSAPGPVRTWIALRSSEYSTYTLCRTSGARISTTSSMAGKDDHRLGEALGADAAPCASGLKKAVIEACLAAGSRFWRSIQISCFTL
mgnify:CR=1 FL=1